MAGRSKINVEAGLCQKGLHSWIDGQIRCKGCRQNSNHNMFENKRDHILDLNRKWKLDNPDYMRNYTRERYQNDLQFRLIKNLRRRLTLALKGNYKAGSAVSDLGCTVEQLKLWFMYQFQLGMTWENYGEWEIDHVKPLSSFDLTNREQLLEAVNWHNLQPLWKKDNREKGTKPWRT